MRVAFIVIAVLLSFQTIAYAANAGDAPYSVYLMRHAEKDTQHADRKDPPLRKCGQERAENLVKFFKHIDLKHIYSTDFNRTKSTAAPTAQAKRLEVEIYDPHKPEIILEKVRSEKQDVLIVGHNQTIYGLAAELAGLDSKTIDGAEYDRLYLVTVFGDTTKFHLLQQSFSCARK